MAEPFLKLTARENAAVKQYRKLAQSKRERYREGLFVLEGLRLTADAVQNGAALTRLFWTEEGLARWTAEGLPIEGAGFSGALLSDSLGEALSQTEHSQGVYAICRMLTPPPLSELLRPDGTYAVLYQLQDPGNMGMILRTADAMGVDGIICAASCDIYSPKVVRATMGSLFRVPVCCTAAMEPVLEACRCAGVETCAAVVSGKAELVGQCSFSAGTAAVIGNEGNGLPPEMAAACDRQVTIPMHGSIESLNAAMAAGIVLWEMKRGRIG